MWAMNGIMGASREHCCLVHRRARPRPGCARAGTRTARAPWLAARRGPGPERCDAAWGLDLPSHPVAAGSGAPAGGPCPGNLRGKPKLGALED